MAFTIVTVAEMQFMAGLSPNAAGDVTANHQFLHDYAAAYLSMILPYDILTNWATLTTVEKVMISEWAARFAGTQIMAYSFLGAADAITRIEAENRISIHIYRMEKIEDILLQVGAKKLLGGS